MARARKGNTLALGKIDRAYAVTTNTVNSANIIRIFQQATVADLEAGVNWYSDANALAKAISPERPEAGAGVIAALSPMMNWDRNMMLAARAFEDGYASGALGNSVRKADMIMAGADPLDVLTSDKVRNFYLCIAANGQTDAVCVDRHALDIALGRVTNDPTRAALKRPATYKMVADAYVRAGATLGYPAAVVQAVTWCVWRRLKGL